MSDTREKKDVSRASLSCIECRRRKQKCSREWPCNHCVARKVSHLCTFGNKGSPNSTSNISDGPKTGNKRRNDHEDSESGIEFDAADAESLGYLNGLPDYNIATLASDVWLSKKVQTASTTDTNIELQVAVQTLPSRSITDSLVQNFLSSVNYIYNSIYPPTFLEEYTRWWLDRAAKKPLSPEFTCLLLRACSLSVQNLPTAMRSVLEFELAEDPATLPEKYHQAAEKLSSTFTPGDKGLTQVQQLFLVVCWFKSEGRFVDSWHAMAKCIREAQELRLHLDDTKLMVNEYEREMRRRLMCVLYMWDFLMSKWLGRPLLIDHSSCTFNLPSLSLELNPDEPNLPSPFAHMTLHVSLMQQIGPSLRDADIDPSEDKVKQLRQMIDKFNADLPRIWAYGNPDSSLDVQYAWLPWQRLLLHEACVIIEMLPIKPYLVGNAKAADPKTQQQFLELGVDCCLKSLSIACKAYEWIKDIDPKQFYINFILFDVLAIMCSTIIHDQDRTLPRREDILQAILHGLATLRLIAKVSQPGATALAFVSKLTESMPLSPGERARFPFGSAKRLKSDPPDLSTAKAFHSGWVKGREVSDSPSTNESVSTYSGPTVGYEVQIPSLQDFQATDFGGMEEMWDWQSLNLGATDGRNGPVFTGFGGQTFL